MTEPDYASALARLPDAHALALRLTDAGAAAADICRALSIEPEGLEPLLEVARRKLDRALRAAAAAP